MKMYTFFNFVCIVTLFFVAVACSDKPTKAIHPEGENLTYLWNIDKSKWNEVLDIHRQLETEGLEYDDIENTEYKQLIDSIDNLKGPLTLSPGCSWYCNGLPSKISVGEDEKEGESIHDFNLFTHCNLYDESNDSFKMISIVLDNIVTPIDEIIIYPGRFDSKMDWKNSIKPKEISMFVNGDRLYSLLLDDTDHKQSFKLDPIGRTSDKVTIELRIERFYGTKKSNIYISEVNLNGTHKH